MLRPMDDIAYHLAYHLAAVTRPKPLPPGTNDYGPLAYVVWIGGGLLILAILFFGVRALLRQTGRRTHG